MEITIEKEDIRDLNHGLSLEWLEVDGLGGWASSSILGCNTRNYHGMLVSSTGQGGSRMVLLSRLDEVLQHRDQEYDLATRVYRNTVAPNGLGYFKRFHLGLFPTFTYQVGEFLLIKSVIAVKGRNLILIRYRLERVDGVSSADKLTLRLRPFVAARDYHRLSSQNSYLNVAPEVTNEFVRFRAYSATMPFVISMEGGHFVSDGNWYNHFFYPREEERGLASEEDLYTYGFIEREIAVGEEVIIFATTEDPASVNPTEELKKEEERRIALVQQPHLKTPLQQRLSLAADQFLFKRPDGRLSIIAGYHWFTDWGRDTMISLPGVCLANRKFDEAKEILRSYLAFLSEGMIPNRFPDGGDIPEYNSVDATLWFFIASWRYMQGAKDLDFLKTELLPALQEIVKAFSHGTRYGIKEQDDGLLWAGVAGSQLTWMDAKVGDWVVTPRVGLPVEINALWYNAIMILAAFYKQIGATEESVNLLERGKKIKSSFVRRFWAKELNYLVDCCSIDALGAQSVDASFRPNQVIALGLPFQLVDKKKGAAILAKVEKELLIPYGLRTISPYDSKYHGHYRGDSISRDGAYHQGTAWAWLLGPYMTALVHYLGDDGKNKAEEVLLKVGEHLTQAGIGSISEIFDGDEPYKPAGCIAQAWSVAEVLRASLEDLQGWKAAPPKEKKKRGARTAKV